jgi:predicted membrane protein
MTMEEELGYYFLLVFVLVLAYWHYISLFVIILILLVSYIKHLKKKKKVVEIEPQKVNSDD